MSTAPIKKMAVLRLDPQSLRDILQLPNGVEVVRVDQDQHYRGGIRLVIEGAGWDTPEGGLLPHTIDATITRFSQGGIEVGHTIHWGLP